MNWSRDIMKRVTRRHVHLKSCTCGDQVILADQSERRFYFLKPEASRALIEMAKADDPMLVLRTIEEERLPPGDVRD